MKVTSIFKSINGEVCKSGQGSWSLFVRFAGCSAKCAYCDTAYSQDPGLGSEYTPGQLAEKVLFLCLTSGIKNITITGGEPLEQSFGDFYQFLKMICKVDLSVSIETNGLHNLDLKDPALQKAVSFVVDYKLPSSGISEKLDRFIPFSPNDFIKFVISTREDYEVAIKKVKHWYITEYTNSSVYFSPNSKELFPIVL